MIGRRPTSALCGLPPPPYAGAGANVSWPVRSMPRLEQGPRTEARWRAVWGPAPVPGRAVPPLCGIALTRPLDPSCRARARSNPPPRDRSVICAVAQLVLHRLDDVERLGPRWRSQIRGPTFPDSEEPCCRWSRRKAADFVRENGLRQHLLDVVVVHQDKGGEFIEPAMNTAVSPASRPAG